MKIFIWLTKLFARFCKLAMQTISPSSNAINSQIWCEKSKFNSVANISFLFLRMRFQFYPLRWFRSAQKPTWDLNPIFQLWVKMGVCTKVLYIILLQITSSQTLESMFKNLSTHEHCSVTEVTSMLWSPFSQPIPSKNLRTMHYLRSKKFGTRSTLAVA